MPILWFLTSIALAVPMDQAMDHPASTRVGTPLQYAADLTGDDRSERLYAARELRRLAVTADRISQRKPSDTQLEARVALADLREDALPAALVAVVAAPDVRAPCADLIAALGDGAAIGTLEAALAAESRPRVQSRIRRAISALSAP